MAESEIPVRRIAVRVQPKASRSEVTGERGGVIQIRVTAPAVDGKANAALVKFVAKKLGIARTQVTLVRGERGREKLLEIRAPEAADARRRLLGATD
ncbi:MAG: DUF167 domain-containing protein [Actinomycetota bacterium]|nr:DUF167 domain-containing protein [Actinomycetota bacterium]